MTTSDKTGTDPSGHRPSAVRILVVVAIVGAVVFGLYIWYLAYANDSFPAQTKFFGNYAVVLSDSFNGTEFAFNLRWENASALPTKAQLTSPATDAANTPVCQFGLLRVSQGQTIFLPFNITPASPSLANVDLSIDVQPLSGGGDFTIVFNVASVSATNTPITPSNVSCQQPLGSS